MSDELRCCTPDVSHWIGLFGPEVSRHQLWCDDGRDELLSAPEGLGSVPVVREVSRCGADFWWWACRWGHIEDKESHGAIRFSPYDCQVDLGYWLLVREWIRALKARRIGITWCLALFAVWLCSLHEMRTVGYIVHKTEFSVDFISRCKFIWRRLPWFLQGRLQKDNRDLMQWGPDSWGSWIRIFPATPAAADSIAADWIIVDEGTKIERERPGLLKVLLRSVEPAVETASGFVTQIATSEGPTGYFFEGWRAAQKGRGKDPYRNLFWPWSAHPKRDEAWYEQEAAEHEADQLYMVRQYPRTPEEAFSHAEGRVYPRFTETRHVGRYGPNGVWLAGPESVSATPEINSAWKCYRAIDWGGVDPFVTLFGCIIPGDGPGLTVDPSCRNLVREMLSYRRRENSEMILDKDNHACDALRYLIVTFNIQAHLHIYRELYIPRSAEQGLGIPQLAEQIITLSGNDQFVGTVADRSRTDLIMMMGTHLEEPVLPHTTPGGHRDRLRHEIEEGIHRVNVLIVGTHAMFRARAIDPAARRWLDIRNQKVPRGVGMTLEESRVRRSIEGRVQDQLANKPRRGTYRRPRSRMR